MRYFPRNRGGWPLKKKTIFVTTSVRNKYNKGIDVADRVIGHLVNQLPEFGSIEECDPWVRNVEAAIDLMNKKAIPAIHQAYDDANAKAKIEYYKGDTK